MVEGREYWKTLDQAHRMLRPRTYLEVGVQSGGSMTLALPGTKCIGIDPEPSISYPLPRDTQILRMTSDDFFASNDPVALFQRVIDLAFIDGMHLFEFALRDIAQVERFAAPSSVILVHDCLPMDRQSATRERTTRSWSGDVWRVIPALRRFRPDLSVVVLDVSPTGLGVITNLDPANRTLIERYDEIISAAADLPFPEDEEARRKLLNVVPESKLASLLPRAYRPEADLDELVAARARRRRSLATTVRRVWRAASR